MTGPGYPPPAAHPEVRATNGLAIAAVVLALAAPPVGVICGHIAKDRIRFSGEAGKGLATAALIVGYILTVVELLATCLAVLITVNTGP
jgi:Domain of unknown function (DUF4190)